MYNLTPLMITVWAAVSVELCIIVHGDTRVYHLRKLTPTARVCNIMLANGRFTVLDPYRCSEQDFQNLLQVELLSSTAIVSSEPGVVHANTTSRKF